MEMAEKEESKRANAGRWTGQARGRAAMRAERSKEIHSNAMEARLGWRNGWGKGSTGKFGQVRTGELGVRREDGHQGQRPPWLSRKTGCDAAENSMGWTWQRTHIRPGAMAGAGLELEGARGQQKVGARESSRARAGSRARAASWSRTPRRKRAIGKHQGIGAAWLGKAPGRRGRRWAGHGTRELCGQASKEPGGEEAPQAGGLARQGGRKESGWACAEKCRAERAPNELECWPTEEENSVRR